MKNKEETKFPVAREYIDGSFIVLFCSEKGGIIIQSPYKPQKVGDYYRNWISCNDKKYWRPVNIQITG